MNLEIKKYYSSIKVKIIFFLFILLSIFISRVIIQRDQENEKIKLFLDQREIENKEHLEKGLVEASKNLDLWAYDYTFWDEIVYFVQNRNMEWAKNIIYPSVKNYNGSAAWIYNKQLDLVLGVNYDQKEIGGCPISKEDFKNIIKKNLFFHFFIGSKDSLLEIFGAPIQPSNDAKRISPHHGFFIVGKYWSKEHLKNVEALTQSKLSLYNANEKYEDQPDPFSTKSIKYFNDVNGKKIIKLVSIKQELLARKFYESNNKQFRYTIAFALLIMVLVTLFVILYLHNPLKIITRSLLNQNSKELNKIKNSNFEFFTLAESLKESFKQKKDLEDQINKRIKVEKVLLQRIEHENLFSKISTMFIDVTADELDGAINNSLVILSHFFEIEKGCLLLMNNDQTTLKEYISWNHSNQKVNNNPFQELSSKNLHWLISNLNLVKKEYCKDYNALEDNNNLEKVNISYFSYKDIYFIPIIYTTGINGFLAFINVNRNYELRPEEIKLIIDIVNVFSHALERKSNEEKIKLANYIIENSSTILFRWQNKVTMPVEYVSQNIKRFGYEASELMSGKVIFEHIIHPEDKRRVVQEISEFINNNVDSFIQQYRILSKDRSVYWVEDRKTLKKDHSSNVSYLEGILIDITSRKLIADELTKSEKKYRTLVSSLKEIIFQTDAEGNWTFLNPAWTEITGYSLEESLGNNFLNYVYPEDREKNFEVFKPLIERKKEYCRHTIRYITKEENFKWIEVHAKLIIDEDDNIIGTSGTLTDVTEKVLAENSLKKAFQKEKELSELKSKFVSMISHEFRTPITSIFSSTELIERYGHKWTTEKVGEHLKRIKKSSDVLVEMLNDILNISKSESGKLEVVLSQVDFKSFCLDLVEEFELIVDNSIEIIFEYKSENTIFDLDEKILRNIFTNLLSNAIKYSPKGGEVHLMVDIDDFLHITVKDNGIGIPEADQNRIFDMFTRAENVGNIKGTGLGMAIVKRSLELLNGEIELLSKVDQGTTVKIKLPIKKNP